MRVRSGNLRNKAETAVDVMLFGGGIVMLAAAGIAIGTLGAVVKGALDVTAEATSWVDRVRTT